MPEADNEILITADTIVWCDGKAFNKPANFVEGKKMLEALSGKMHEVFTGICLKSGNKQTTFYDVSKVYWFINNKFYTFIRIIILQ